MIYNEIDPKAARWLRQLIADGHLPEGEVIEKSIIELEPDEVSETSHFFAGIGVWAYALKQAEWPREISTWTGSCPCQPFSVVGSGKGLKDKRHLWPEFRKLIAACLPSVVFGEQTASPAGRTWFSAVRADLEELGYEVGSADLCAASVGAPHIRQRLYFGAVRLGDSSFKGLEGLRRYGYSEPEGEIETRHAAASSVSHRRRLGYSDRQRSGRLARTSVEAKAESDQPGLAAGTFNHPAQSSSAAHEWSEVEWLYCRDQKYRPAQPGIQPLVDGPPARVVRLSGYGNALVAPLAVEFVKAFGESILMRKGK